MRIKKLAAMVAATTMAAISAFSIVGCGGGSDENAHTHNYTKWRYNDTQHWRECPEDGAESEKSNHVYGSDNKCECGALNPNITPVEPGHTHSYTKWGHDDTYHWKECSANDGAIDESSKVQHTFSDGVCNTCGALDNRVPVGPTKITNIEFRVDGDNNSKPYWEALINAYNNGQGKIDGVKVVGIISKGTSTSTSASALNQSAAQVGNVYALADGQDALRKLQIFKDPNSCPDGLFLDLTPYIEKDEDFKKNTINPQLMDWFKFSLNRDAKEGAGNPKSLVGKGAAQQGIPFATNVQFNIYNKDLFKAQGVNIINVPEDELTEWNEDNDGKVMPHGYAEYKRAPYDGAVSSKTLYGDTVYKVFNASIGMNWEEQRNFLKYFSKTYNTTSASDYGFVSEYWFNYGWSVGGDVMGWNGNDYDFTLLDKNPNYIVTKKDTTVGSTVYQPGEIVRYEDKIIDDCANIDGLYAIKSQYDAVKEYVSLQRPIKGKGLSQNDIVDTVDGKTYYGYGVANTDTGSQQNLFNNRQVAMVRSTPEQIATYSEANKVDFDFCVPESYREYEGGSVYYADNADKSEIENERLKVIGETYNGEVYTGRIKTVNGTKIVGNDTSCGTTQGLFIPVRSDSSKYQASWDFISWVATEGQRYVADVGSVAPVSKDVCFGYYLNNVKQQSNKKNYYAIGRCAYNAGTGDWGYFENGSWVTNWANVFNNEVRRSNKQLSVFGTQCAARAKSDLDAMLCVIKGIR